MKILRKPLTDEDWSIKVYCTGFGHGDQGCGAKLKVYRDDLRYHAPANGEDGAVTFCCANCGQLNNLGIENYPINHKQLRKRVWKASQ